MERKRDAPAPSSDVNICASEAKIARTDVDSRRSRDTTFEREVSNVVVGVNVNKNTSSKTLERGENDLQACSRRKSDLETDK